MNRADLERLSRDALVARAEEAGVSRARVLTRPELVDELLLRSAADQATKLQSRGLFGRARDLLARLVERGLHLPEAADRIRSLGAPIVSGPSAPAALPTVTLAEIYAAQGHRSRAIETLERVLSREPDHTVARELIARLGAADYPVISPRLPPDDDDSTVAAAEDSSAAGTAPSATHDRGGPSGAATSGPVASGAAADEGPGGDRLAAEPMEMLDDAPLPELYDVDECVAMPVDPATLYVYWEVRERTLAQVRATRPGAILALRFVVVLATWDGPRSMVRDEDVHVALGDFFARDLPGGSIVRVAIGVRHDAGFEPIAHAGSLEMPTGAPGPLEADVRLRWTPDGVAASGDRDDPPTAGRSKVPVSAEGAFDPIARPSPDPHLGASERWVP